ncbi:MAG TPA: hypothetical protein VD973_26950 [Symbiobacteriaceae bacterium]|nr:hypothetical protein [Symbiobacteriaceae bacterium]
MHPCHYEAGALRKAAAVFSAPGRHEQAAGRPAAAGTGKQLALLGEVLAEQGLDLLARRGDFTITNAWAGVEYDEATGRSEATDAEVLRPDNLDRLAGELSGITDCVFCFGDKAHLAVAALAEAGRLEPGCRAVKVRHLSMRSLNQIRADVHGAPIVAAGGDPEAGRANTRRRIGVIAAEILRGLR